MSTVIVVDDDPDAVLAVRSLLTRAGYSVADAPDGRSGLRIVQVVRPDLLLLDIGLPDIDGWRVLEAIRDFTNVPVMMLTAHSRDQDKVRGLRSGADDYVTKPFVNSELLARIEALLRRAGVTSWSDENYDDGRLRLSAATRSAWADGREVRLTPIEYRLLSLLVKYRGVALTPNQLLGYAWLDPIGFAPDRVKFAMLRLRRKLGWPYPDTSPLESIRGLGYRYRAPVD